MVGEAIDIVLVAESNNASYYWMGFDSYSCPGNLCLDSEWSSTNSKVFRYWGYFGDPGKVWPGKVTVDNPGVIGISLSEEGPFTDGPIDLFFTVEDNGTVSRSDKIYIKALGLGSATVLACIGDGRGTEVCDPYSRYGHMESGPWEVAASEVLTNDYVGLRDIGEEVVDALDNRFCDDYNFGFVAFGAYPSLVNCNPLDNWPQWRPYAETQPFYDWVDLTNDAPTIISGLSNTQLICSSPITWGPYGQSGYSAILHAINETPWRQGAKRVIIVFMESTVNWELPADLTEPVTGYTHQTVIDEAVARNVSLFTIVAGSSRNIERLSEMATTTGGKTYDGISLYPMLNTLETVFDDIKDMYGNIDCQELKSAEIESAEIEIVPDMICKLWPNPAQTEFYLYNGNNYSIQIYVTDMLGRRIEFINNVGIKETVVFGSNYKPGLYFVKVSENGIRKVFKAVKNK